MGMLAIVAAVLCGWTALTLLGAERAKRLHRLREQIRRETLEAAARAKERREVPILVGEASAPNATFSAAQAAARK